MSPTTQAGARAGAQIAGLSVSDLAQECAGETHKFMRGQAYGSTACLELLRRCIVERDQQAWHAVHAQYQREVLTWVSRHPRFPGTGESAEYFANGAFTRFFLHLTPDKFGRFPNLAALLRYLQLCVHSEVSNYPTPPANAGLEDAPPAPETDIHWVDRQSFWQHIRRLLHDSQELAVVYASFILDLKPREIYTRMPALFSSISDVYRVKANVLERLARAPEIKRFLEDHA